MPQAHSTYDGSDHGSSPQADDPDPVQVPHPGRSVLAGLLLKVAYL